MSAVGPTPTSPTHTVSESPWAPLREPQHTPRGPPPPLRKPRHPPTLRSLRPLLPLRGTHHRAGIPRRIWRGREDHHRRSSRLLLVTPPHRKLKANNTRYPWHCLNLLPTSAPRLSSNDLTFVMLQTVAVFYPNAAPPSNQPP